MTGAEEWRPVVGYEGRYEVSSFGRARRIVPGTRGTGFIGTGLDAYGYYVAILSLGTIASRQRKKLHQLVAEAFIGPCPTGLVVNHLDGVKTNNVPTNLEYTTREENLRHAGKAGLMAHSQHNGRAVLTVETVKAVREMAKTMRQVDICKLTGLHSGHVSLIVNRRIWGRVD